MTQVESGALIWCPCPDIETARAIAASLLAESLIACANLIGGIESHFIWEGRQDSARETGLLCKTAAGALDAAIARIGQLHPYDTPAILGWRCDAAHPSTLAWLGEQGPPKA